MKSIFYWLFSILLVLGSVPAFAHIGIEATTSEPSAALEVSSQSNNKGILIPRLNGTQKNTISNTVEGLLIHQTTAPIGFYYYTGTAWKLIINAKDLDAAGNAATNTTSFRAVKNDNDFAKSNLANTTNNPSSFTL